MHFLSSENLENQIVILNLPNCHRVSKTKTEKLCSSEHIHTTHAADFHLRGKQYLSSMLAKQWLIDLHGILGHHDYTNDISAVQSKMQIFTTLP